MNSERLKAAIGGCIRAWRKHRGMSQEQLAAILGIKQPCISRFESGKTFPQHHGDAIASAFGIDPEVMLTPPELVDTDDIEGGCRQ